MFLPPDRTQKPLSLVQKYLKLGETVKRDIEKIKISYDDKSNGDTTYK